MTAEAAMTVTAKLLRLFRVEQQLKGLRTRLDAAERYLHEQDKQLSALDANLKALKTQCRQLEAAAANDEGEANRIEARVAKLREQMNSAKTNKEYSTFLSEINTLKADKGEVDERALGSLNKLEEMRAQIAEIEAAKAERKKVRAVAQSDRDERESEIKDRLNELQAERDAAAREVPATVLAIFEDRVERADEIDDVMAALEVHDRKRMEFLCGSCQVLLPMEKINSLLGRGDMATCTSCGCLLYVEESVRDAVTPTSKK
jgi:predicted  nucleic acid-binding Zn-ribbon protein